MTNEIVNSTPEHLQDKEIQEFSISVAELEKLASSYSSLSIVDENDKVGIVSVDTARKRLKKERSELSKFGKAMRDPYTKMQKGIIAKEKELIAIIEPVEKALQAKLDKVKEDKAIKENQPKLDDRKTKLEGLGDIDERAILLMGDEVFDAHVAKLKTPNINPELLKLIEESAKYISTVAATYGVEGDVPEDFADDYKKHFIEKYSK